MLGLAELTEEVYDELGGVDSTIAQLVEDADITRYLNQGQRRLGHYVESQGDISWAAAATSVAFPSDYYELVDVLLEAGSVLEPNRIWNGGIHFLDEAGAQAAGNARILYYARPAAITDTQASQLTDEGDTAIVSYACYRIFLKLASGRSDYRRYATITASNGVDIAELQAHAERYLEEFESVQDQLPQRESANFYGD